MSDLPPYRLAALRRGVGRSDMLLVGGLAQQHGLQGHERQRVKGVHGKHVRDDGVLRDGVMLVALLHQRGQEWSHLLA